MSDLIADFHSLRWWISVVVAGILVNMVATYLMRLVDARLTKMSSWWRQRKAVEERERAAIVDALRADRNRQAQLEADEVRSRLRSLVLLVQAVGMGVIFVVAAIMGAPAWLFTTFFVMYAYFWYRHDQQWRRAERASGLLAEVHEPKNRDRFI